LQCVAVCCSVLQCVAVCCSVLQCVAVCCSVSQCVAELRSVLQGVAVCFRVLHKTSGFPFLPYAQAASITTVALSPVCMSRTLVEILESQLATQLTI